MPTSSQRGACHAFTQSDTTLLWRSVLLAKDQDVKSQSLKFLSSTLKFLHQATRLNVNSVYKQSVGLVLRHMHKCLTALNALPPSSTRPPSNDDKPTSIADIGVSPSSPQEAHTQLSRCLSVLSTFFDELEGVPASPHGQLPAVTAQEPLLVRFLVFTSICLCIQCPH